MKRELAISAVKRRLIPALALLAILAVRPCRAGGVTIITHGLNGNVAGWVTGMATNIPHYVSFPGTNFTCYEMYFFNNAGSYYLTAARVSGSQPFSPESGEIIIKLNWQQLADGNSYNTYQIASAVVPALLNTNFITELDGHALAEFPMHLVGHSRGGSLVCEMSRLLGTNGVWVDQVTTLDPHPLNNDGFNLDIFLYSAVDAPARTYSNVLFHDNYWQDLEFFTRGEPVGGAYVRKLNSLTTGGYSSSHSDTHLWYHGTLDGRTPTTDTEASLTSAERNAWWVSGESQGGVAGFYYSLIGGGNRLSTARPLGPGFPAIRDGYNQWWDLGAGTSTNRTPLPSNNGSWPNLIKFNRLSTNTVVQGQTTLVKYYYQWAQPTNTALTVSFYLDDDFNPLNGNQNLVGQLNATGTTAGNVNFQQVLLTLTAKNASPGYHAFLAKITGGGKSRCLYAPELVQVLAFRPVLDIAQLNAAQYRIGVSGLAGQTVILQNSTDLQTWLPLATNTLATDRWVYTNSPPGNPGRRFYRAVPGP